MGHQCVIFFYIELGLHWKLIIIMMPILSPSTIPETISTTSAAASDDKIGIMPNLDEVLASCQLQVSNVIETGKWYLIEWYICPKSQPMKLLPFHGTLLPRQAFSADDRNIGPGVSTATRKLKWGGVVFNLISFGFLFQNVENTCSC